jgi:hypothetical protein
MPLIVLPSNPATQQASAYLTAEGIAHQVVAIPEVLGYKTGADIAIYVTPDTVAVHGDVAMRLTKQRLVVMRVFKRVPGLDDVLPS